MTSYNRNTSMRRSGGFTLIETVITFTISAIILVGLMLSATAILGVYQKDYVSLDLTNYGNLMLREITKHMDGAKDIKVSDFNDMTRIEITDWQGHQKFIDATKTKGFFVDNRSLMDGVTLPLKGLYRTVLQNNVALTDFKCEDGAKQKLNIPYRGATAFESAVFLVSFTLSLTTIYSDADPITENFKFTRQIFASSKFLTSKHAPVGPPPGARTTP